MNNGFLDVAQGTARRKALIQQLAQQAAARVQQNRATSRFSSYSQLGTDTTGRRFGLGRRTATPALAGGGIRATAGGSGLNISDAYTQQAVHGRGQGRPDQSQAPGIPVGQPGAQANTNPDGSTYDPSLPVSADNPVNFGGYSSSGQAHTDFATPSPSPAWSGVSASAPPGTAAPGGASGMIPLGNGVFFDPSTGLLHGAGAASNSYGGGAFGGGFFNNNRNF